MYDKVRMSKRRMIKIYSRNIGVRHKKHQTRVIENRGSSEFALKKLEKFDEKIIF